jgi:hypothetical protein
MITWLWDNNNTNKNQKIFIVLVDGTHCRINEPWTQPSVTCYSSKYNKAGFTYELGISIHNNKLIWINGPPFPAGTNDIHIFRKEGSLKSKIPAGKRVVGDEGYKGKLQISTWNPL